MVVGVALGRSALDVVIVFFADVKLAAHDGLDAVLVRGVDEVHRAKNISVVGHGDGGHAEFFHALAELFDVAGAVEQGVIGMEVQVNELGHRVSLILRRRHSSGKRACGRDKLSTERDILDEW